MGGGESSAPGVPADLRPMQSFVASHPAQLSRSRPWSEIDTQGAVSSSRACGEDGLHLVDALLQPGLREVPGVLGRVAVLSDGHLRAPVAKIGEGD
jgi:hypothetical protein